MKPLDTAFPLGALCACALALAGCSLTPKQMEKVDGVICNHFEGFAVKSTTVAIGGASKPGAVNVTPDCQVTVANVPAVRP